MSKEQKLSKKNDGLSVFVAGIATQNGASGAWTIWDKGKLIAESYFNLSDDIDSEFAEDCRMLMWRDVLNYIEYEFAGTPLFIYVVSGWLYKWLKTPYDTLTSEYEAMFNKLESMDMEWTVRKLNLPKREKFKPVDFSDYYTYNLALEKLPLTKSERT